MNKVTELLTKRLKKSEKSSKMAALARESAEGRLSGFAGIFSVSELSSSQKNNLEQILESYTTGDQNIFEDLESLTSITAEVQAINNQAAILHGERIKKAQTILKRYRDGAFSAWLVATYGNRQTPYNLLQYYEFYHAFPQELRPQIEAMPRQAIYTLASRDGPIEKKRQIIEQYQGQTKNELICLIREQFPLDDNDKRKQNVGDNAIRLLKQLCSLVNDQNNCSFSKTQQHAISDLITLLSKSINQCNPSE